MIFILTCLSTFLTTFGSFFHETLIDGHQHVELFVLHERTKLGGDPVIENLGHRLNEQVCELCFGFRHDLIGEQFETIAHELTGTVFVFGRCLGGVDGTAHEPRQRTRRTFPHSFVNRIFNQCKQTLIQAGHKRRKRSAQILRISCKTLYGVAGIVERGVIDADRLPVFGLGQLPAFEAVERVGVVFVVQIYHFRLQRALRAFDERRHKVRQIRHKIVFHQFAHTRRSL
mmetsp:Transcript_4878/g.7860  ORF Transcript_4878/g.7860 Transcript_4878/m.7860 type:complete len:229 (-) Transcript_4878:1815-2501(-)